MPDSQNDATGTAWLAAIIDTFHQNKEHADQTIAQLPDDKLRLSLDAETNSVAVIMKHVAGNLRSRWKGFLESDGEKPDRARDQEFIDDYADREAILNDWEEGWQVLFDELAKLQPSDISREITIRGHQLSVPHAIARSMSHCSYHIGQIVQVARIQVGDDWKTLSIPRGQSDEYNRNSWGDTGSPP